MHRETITWHPYPEVRPPETGAYMVTHQNGGVNFGRYEGDHEHGHFNVFRCRVIAWANRPKGYMEGVTDVGESINRQ